MKKVLSILAVLAVLSVMTVNSAQAVSINIFDFGGILHSANVSESPATAERATSPINSYGYEVTKHGTGNNDIVCGDHLCADGEQPPKLHIFGDYSRGD